MLYARDLAATEIFWRDVLGLEPFHTLPGRQIFYRCGNQVVLIFNPDATEPAAQGRRPSRAAAWRHRRRPHLLPRLG